jgi:hypothetical protein
MLLNKQQAKTCQQRLHINNINTSGLDARSPEDTTSATITTTLYSWPRVLHRALTLQQQQHCFESNHQGMPMRRCSPQPPVRNPHCRTVTEGDLLAAFISVGSTSILQPVNPTLVRKRQKCMQCKCFMPHLATSQPGWPCLHMTCIDKGSCSCSPHSCQLQNHNHSNPTLLQ